MKKHSYHHLKILLIISIFVFVEIYFLLSGISDRKENLNSKLSKIIMYRYSCQSYSYCVNSSSFSFLKIASFRKKSRCVFSLNSRIELRKQKKKPFFYPFKLPLKGEFRISSPFGYRYHPILKKRLFHKGIDLASPRGTKIYPVSPGIVKFAGWRGEYGRLVIIDHQNGYQSYYAHCSKLLVKKGEKVSYTDVIAKVGKSGLASGYHLHLEIRYHNKPLNPKKLISFSTIIAMKSYSKKSLVR